MFWPLPPLTNYVLTERGTRTKTFIEMVIFRSGCFIKVLALNPKLPYWSRIDSWQGFMIVHERSWNFTTLIRTIFPGCSWFLIALWQGLHVFWWPKISATSKTTKNHEIPSTQFNVMSFHEVSRKFMKVEDIHPWFPWNFPGSSWFDSLGLESIIIPGKWHSHVHLLFNMCHYMSIRSLPVGYSLSKRQ